MVLGPIAAFRIAERCSEIFLDKTFPCVLPVTLSGRSVADDLGAKALAGGLR